MSAKRTSATVGQAGTNQTSQLAGDFSQAPNNNDAFKRNNLAAFRALAADPNIEVSYKAGNASLHGDKAVIPPPPFNADETQINECRGAADMLALRSRFHDTELHAKLTPKGDIAGSLYEAMENARVEALGCQNMQGVKKNIASSLDKYYRQLGYHQLQEPTAGSLADAARLFVRQHLTGMPPPPAAENICKQWQEHLQLKLAPYLGDLQEHLQDQAEYAKRVAKLLHDLDMEIDPNQDGDDDVEDDEGEAEDNPESQSRADSDDKQSPDQDSGDTGDEQGDTGDDDGENLEQESAASDDDDSTLASGEQFVSDDDERYRPEHDLGNIGKEKFYNIFTTRFDSLCNASDLAADEAEIEKLREALDNQMENLSMATTKLANRLQRKLQAIQQRSWEFDLEEGLLDTARLPRIITDPLQPLAFKREKPMVFRDTIVTLLIDNSGSMRGRPISIAAMCADILARTLERCGVNTEVLGFTTQQWKGGQSRMAWTEADKPLAPGRLNDLLHIIYKPADEPYRRARRKFGLMLKEGLLKENIDGEALQWACKRLFARSEERRILMVISDGAPVDDSTLSINQGNYLERHLRDVIDDIQTYTDIELVAIGIGHDVTRYYQRAVTIMDAEELAGKMTEQLADLFEESTNKLHKQ